MYYISMYFVNCALSELEVRPFSILCFSELSLKRQRAIRSAAINHSPISNVSDDVDGEGGIENSVSNSLGRRDNSGCSYKVIYHQHFKRIFVILKKIPGV